MNRQNYFIKNVFWVLCIFILIGTSCNKQINTAPIGSTYSEEFWKSEHAVDQATLDLYGQLRSCLRADASHFIFGDLASGVFAPAHSEWKLSSITPQKKFNFSYVPYLGGSLHNWSRFYQLVAQSNLILQEVPKMPASLFQSKDTRNEFLGEALFMRAFAYFYMIRVWGDPVYVTKTFDGADYGNIPPIPRTAENEVLDSCLRDLRMAVNYLSDPSDNPVRANKDGGYALMAHIFAWQHKYDSAHVYCQKVINSGKYSLEPMATYSNIWNSKGSAENIFVISMLYAENDPNFKNDNSWAEAKFGFFGTFLKDALVDDRKASCWVATKEGQISWLYEDTTNDARFKAILMDVSASGGDGEGYLLTKYSDFIYQSPDSKAYPYLNNNLVLFRLSDIILLDAEALANLEDLEGARALLAMTEDRAGIDHYKTIGNTYNMRDEIVMERGRELIGEGQFFYDLIRTEKVQSLLERRLEYTPDRILNKGYYWPINMKSLFPYDNLLTQNPYWAKYN